MPETILVTGVTGLVGGKLAEMCREKGIKVIGLSSKDQDVRDILRIKEPVDYIIHLASPTGSDFFIERPAETMDIIFNGAKNILDFARANNVKSVVFVSSVEVYGKNITDEPLLENDYSTIDLNSVRSSYMLGKASAELLSRSYFAEYGVPVKIARLSTVVPERVTGRDNRLICFVARSAKKDGKIKLATPGKKIRTYVALGDAATALLHILLSGKNGETYNIAHPDGCQSVRQIVELVARETNATVEFGKGERIKYPSDSNWNVSSNKLIGLGWKPKKTIPEAIRELIAYYGDTL